jgi:hypothetical protein
MALTEVNTHLTAYSTNMGLREANTVPPVLGINIRLQIVSLFWLIRAAGFMGTSPSINIVQRLSISLPSFETYLSQQMEIWK